ncbi:MAG: hypothetical protein HY319_04955 [Armatimonadetes bacterium]|nr:hypothetical protein [Armatimonadota bacterium]
MPGARGTRRGFTVAEALVSGLLLVLILGLLLNVMVPVFRSWLRSDRRGQAQDQCALVVARLREEIRAAHPESVAAISDPVPAVLWVSSLDPQGRVMYDPYNNDMLWQRRSAMYLEPESGRVLFVETPDVDLQPSTPPGPVSRLDNPAETSWFVPVSAPRARVVARNIAVFQVAWPDGTPPGPLDVRVESEVDGERSELITALVPLQSPAPGQPASPSPVP